MLRIFSDKYPYNFDQLISMELYNVHQRLKEIQKELYGYNNFTSETMVRVGKLAIEIKPIAVKIFGYEDEVTGELESAILISKNYHPKKSLELEIEIIIEALRHLEYGTALFLEEIEY